MYPESSQIFADVAATAGNSSHAVPDPERILSIDVFRGATIAAMLLVDGQGGTETFAMFKHSEWNGLTFTDCIAPCFMWIVGVSLFISVNKRFSRGDKKTTIFRQALRRFIILFAIGLSLSLLLPALAAVVHWNADALNSWQLMGTLQRIAIGYLIAAIVILILDKPLSQIAVVAALLVVYTGIFYLAPAPGFSPGDFSEPGNAVTHLDRLLLGNHAQSSHPVLNSIPAGAMVLLGVLVGRLLTGTSRQAIRLGTLVGAGGLLVTGGFFLSDTFPINYKLWTPSFFMAAGGIACLSFAVFYWTLETGKIKRGTLFLGVLGMNPILVWVLAVFSKSLLDAMGFFDDEGRWRSIWQILFEKISFAWLSSEINALLFSVTFSLVLCGIAQGLYSRKIFIRI